jgi:hypothetical protein
MSQELWATYSVEDHLNPRALATDIMLFDRLVFPVPETAQFGVVPTQEFPQNNGDPTERGPVEWKRNPTEWARWVKEGWDPDSQNQLLKRLDTVIRKQSWVSEGSTYDHYRSEAARLATQGVPDYAFVATRTTLTRERY